VTHGRCEPDLGLWSGLCCRDFLGRSNGVRLGAEQRYPAAQLNDEVQIDPALLLNELDVSAWHLQRQRTGNRANFPSRTTAEATSTVKIIVSSKRKVCTRTPSSNRSIVGCFVHVTWWEPS
jgi:hypothetical protein